MTVTPTPSPSETKISQSPIGWLCPVCPAPFLPASSGAVRSQREIPVQSPPDDAGSGPLYSLNRWLPAPLASSVYQKDMMLSTLGGASPQEGSCVRRLEVRDGVTTEPRPE